MKKNNDNNANEDQKLEPKIGTIEHLEKTYKDYINDLLMANKQHLSTIEYYRGECQRLRDEINTKPKEQPKQDPIKQMTFDEMVQLAFCPKTLEKEAKRLLKHLLKIKKQNEKRN